jgi:polysaccharide export outer membrane protein
MRISWMKPHQRCAPAAWLLAAAALLSVGCVPTYTDHEAFVRTPTPVVGGKPYVIEPPDSIRLIAPNAPELNNTRVTLRPDGYVTFYLVGEVFAAGKTPAQLSAEIEEKVMRYYQDATVQVEVVSYASKVYYIAGETRAGPKPYTGRDTVLDAVLGAGIPRSAWPQRLIVMRPDESGDMVHRMSVNVDDMIKRGDLHHNAVLEEGDILYMPQNPLAKIGSTVQNLLMPVDPLIEAGRVPASAATFGATP